MIAPHIRKCFEMYATGNYNIQKIADYLNENNIKPKYGREIHESYIARMFRNTFYTGKFTWNEAIYEGKHETFISQELFTKVQSVLDAHNQYATRKRKHSFLLRGFIFCADCNRQIWSDKHTKPSGNVYRLYFCAKCGKGTYIDSDKLERNVEKMFRKIQISDSYVEHVLATAKRILETDRSNQDTEKRRLSTEKSKIERAMREAEDARFVTHSITEEAFTRIYSRYEKELKNVDSTTNNLQRDHTKSVSILTKVLRLAENIGEAYVDADYLLKRNYLGIFFKRFEVKSGKIIKYELTDELKPLIKNGSVRVSATGLRD